MKKVWKWIIGIVLVVLVLGAIFAVPFAMHTFFAPAFALRVSGDGTFVPGAMMRQGQFDEIWPRCLSSWWDDGTAMKTADQVALFTIRVHIPVGGMMGFGFSPFGIFRWIIPLAVIGLAVYGVIALIRRRPAATVPAETAPVVSSRSCGSCGKPAMDEWKNCPYCGNSL